MPREKALALHEPAFGEDKADDPAWQCLQLLKGHAIELLSRTKPSKKGYYKLVWENFTLSDLLNFQMENVFSSKEQSMEDHEGRGMTFRAYLEEVFENLIEKLHESEMEPKQKERLVLD